MGWVGVGVRVGVRVRVGVGVGVRVRVRVRVRVGSAAGYDGKSRESSDASTGDRKTWEI